MQQQQQQDYSRFISGEEKVEERFLLALATDDAHVKLADERTAYTVH